MISGPERSILCQIPWGNSSSLLFHLAAKKKNQWTKIRWKTERKFGSYFWDFLLHSRYEEATILISPQLLRDVFRVSTYKYLWNMEK